MKTCQPISCMLMLLLPVFSVVTSSAGAADLHFDVNDISWLFPAPHKTSDIPGLISMDITEGRAF